MKHEIQDLSGRLLHQALAKAVEQSYVQYKADVDAMGTSQLTKHLKEGDIVFEPGASDADMRELALACHEYAVFPRDEKLPLRHGQLWKFCEELITNHWISVGPILEKNENGLSSQDSKRIFEAKGNFFKTTGKTPGDAVVRCYLARVFLGTPDPRNPRMEIEI